MGKGAVKVVLRTRPTERFADNLKLQDASSLNFFFPKKKDSGGVGASNIQEHFSFKYDGILHNAGQETVYEEVARPVIGSLLQGVNSTVMAYGQTGAGKTYTMTGGSDFKSRGLIPRTITDLFAEISHLPEKVFEVKVSYMEIYNEKIYDLLGSSDASQGLAIQEDTMQGITVKGLELCTASNEAEALSLLFNGNQRRAMGEHTLNENSTRSHCIYTIYVKSRSRVESDGHSLQSKLNMVDLAGSERVAKTGSEGSILKEAMYINKSLSFLEQVVIALGSAHRPHVPYRQCKLTNYLKDSLGGNCKTVMVANVWGEERHLEETLSTLKFAARMMKVQNDVTANSIMDPAGQIKMLQKQIQELKAELQMQNQLHGKSHIKYDAFSDDERFDLEKRVQQYLSGTLEEIEVRNLRDVKEYFKLFKACVLRATSEAEENIRAKYTLTEQEPDRPANGAPPDQEVPDGTGELDAASGFGIGTGAAAKGIKNTIGATSPGKSSGVPPSPELGEGGQYTQEGTKSITLPDRSQAYEDFKNNEGAELNQNLKIHATKLRDLKQEGLEKGGMLQELKTAIEELKRQAEDSMRVTHDSDEIVDAESAQLLEDLKRKKFAYRELHDNLMCLRTEKESVIKLSNQARQQLVSTFEAWYTKTYSDSLQQDSAAYVVPQV